MAHRIDAPGQWPGLRSLDTFDKIAARRYITEGNGSALAALGVSWPLSADDHAFLAEQAEEAERAREELERALGEWTGDCPMGDRCEVCGAPEGLLTVEPFRFCEKCGGPPHFRFCVCPSRRAPAVRCTRGPAGAVSGAGSGRSWTCTTFAGSSRWTGGRSRSTAGRPTGI